MKHLSMVARIATPAAMVVFLSYELSRSLAVSGGWYVALLIGSVATAVGIEIVGILAGHTLEGYWRLGDSGRGLLSFALLMVYTLAAVYVLRGNSVLAAVPVVAAIVYILAALSDGLTTAVKQVDEKAAVQQDYALENQRAEDEHRRRMETAQLKLRHEERLARIQTVAPPVVSQETKEETEETARQRMERLWKPGMKPTELATLAAVSKGYASKYINNGALKHYQLGANQ